MPPVPSTAAAPLPLAQDTPLQSWLSSWLAYLSDNLPAIFIVVAVLAGLMVLVKGGIKQTLMFALAAGLAFLLLTNLESVAQFFNDELPLPPDVPAAPDSPEPTNPEPTTEPA